MKVSVYIHQIGMSFRSYSRKNNIDKPYFTKKYNLKSSGDCLLSEVINQAINKYFTEYPLELCSYTKELLIYENHNIFVKGYYFHAINEKTLFEVKHDLGLHNIRIELFVFTGGASRNYEGYRYVVHPNEYIHKNMPHVHVEKDGYSVRYSLLTFDRFEKDKCSSEIIRDEKKRIIPYIKKNRKLFMKWWNIYQKGYITPELDNDKKQLIGI